MKCKMMKSYIIIFCLAMLPGLAYRPLAAQNDTLTLSGAISVAISSHPTIKGAEQAVEEAEGRIGIARASWLPGVDASASYSRIGPVPSFDFPEFGHIKLYPEDNYTMAVNIRQLIYDFGRTNKSIELAEASKDISSESVKLVKQNLAMSVISTYYQLLLVQESLRINEDELQNLNEHLDFITRKQETGSATDYEILSTKVKISAVQNQRVDLIAGQEALAAAMNALLGRPVDQPVTVAMQLGLQGKSLTPDSILSTALKNREEVRLSEEQEKIAGLRYELAKSMNNPTISAFASGGGKNGYYPDLYAFKPNFTAGLSLNIPLFDGNREKSNLRIAKAGLMSSQFESDNVRRTVSADVIRARSEVSSSSKKISQFELQVKQAAQAYDLAQTNYRAGVITNLDLLDAEISLATSRLMLTKARIDYALDLSRLKMALGEDLYDSGT
jgi:outer membrane protein